MKPALLLKCSVLVLLGCFPSGRAAETPPHLKGLIKLSRERVDLNARMSTLCVAPPDISRPNPHRRSAILVYSNKVALDYRRAHPDGHGYPVGTVFLKEKYAGRKAAAPHLATLMKRSAEKGDISDWEFSVITLPDGKPQTLSAKDAAACADCHGDFGKRGFISRYTESMLRIHLEPPAPPNDNREAARPALKWKDFDRNPGSNDTLHVGALARPVIDPATSAGIIARDDSELRIQDNSVEEMTVRRHHADSKGFLKLSAEAEKLREQRLLSETDFARMAGRKDVVVLDPRSRRTYDRQHVSGAVNLPYTDFTPDSLAEVIPSKDTAVLIYCDNHIDYPQPQPDSQGSGINVLIGGGFKGATAALTLPTFITLYGYGYRNLYELGPVVKPGESVIDFVEGD